MTNSELTELVQQIAERACAGSFVGSLPPEFVALAILNSRYLRDAPAVDCQRISIC